MGALDLGASSIPQLPWIFAYLLLRSLASGVIVLILLCVERTGSRPSLHSYLLTSQISCLGPSLSLFFLFVQLVARCLQLKGEWKEKNLYLI